MLAIPALMEIDGDYRRLDVPAIEKLTGANLYYGATIAEAFSIQGQYVFIVGGVNSAE